MERRRRNHRVTVRRYLPPATSISSGGGKWTARSGLGRPSHQMSIRSPASTVSESCSTRGANRQISAVRHQRPPADERDHRIRGRRSSLEVTNGRHPLHGIRRHSGVSLSGAEPVSAPSEAEVPRSLEVGTDPCMALTDLGQLLVRMKCMEHRSMSFLSRTGTLVETRDDARIRRSGAPPAQGSSRRQVASGHTARGARPAIFTLVSNIDMGTSFRADGHNGPPPRCRSSEFRDAFARAPRRAAGCAMQGSRRRGGDRSVLDVSRHLRERMTGIEPAFSAWETEVGRPTDSAVTWGNVR